MRPPLTQRPIDATLSVTKAARLLGVHPNTVRAWSDQGRLRFYRINPRGDRRYRIGDLQRFLAAAEHASHPAETGVHGPDAAPASAHAHVPLPAPSGGALATATPASDSDQPVGVSMGREESTAPGVLRAEVAGSGDDSPEPIDLPITVGAAIPGASLAARRTPPALDVAHDAARVAGDGGRLVRLLGDLATTSASGRSLAQTLERAVRLIRSAYAVALVGAWELDGDRLTPVAADGTAAAGLVEVPASIGTMGRALANRRAARTDDRAGAWWLPVLPGLRAEIAAPITVEGRTWGVLLAGVADDEALSDAHLAVFDTLAAQVGVAVHTARLLGRAALQLHRADALRRVANDITSKLDLEQILSGLVDHAMVLFEADRAGVFLRQPDGSVAAAAARGLSASYLRAVRGFPNPSLPAAAVAARRPLFAVRYSDDPSIGSLRAAVIQEGFDTLCTAPLFDGSEFLGVLNLYHDRPHRWSDDELETVEAFAAQASIAIRTAQNYAQMATWAAQLQSIQQLGARLNRLTTVREIGLTIATELNQLIDYHNVRVYRLYGADLVPVAMHGQVGEYIDETPEQLRLTIDEGVTGWVARHGVAQYLPDAAKDPRVETIPGTEDDLDESMLLAPMIFEDRVLGVVVLSKLGLNQFRDDDLRLLVIYASFAAQAMANADATELLREQSAALERQLRSQRDLLQITESILGTLEPRAVLDQIADRLAGLVRYDNIVIELYDGATMRLHPLTARGVHRDELMAEWRAGETGLATWVIEHNEPQLVADELADPRVLPLEATGPVEGSLIAVPLRGREGAVGVLTLERLGRDDRFREDEFELVKLFAAQVSIALQNAEVHTAVEVRARSDDLTGLLNHGTFKEWLARSVNEREPFSLIMLDLDEFKAVNDALGHQAGDLFLRDVARAIVAAGRETDQVFRYGGDEFCLLLPGTDGEGARLVAERVRAAIATLGQVGSPWQDARIESSASIGIASFPVDGTSTEDMLLAADRACFVAKRRGRHGIATAVDGRAVAGEFSLQEPTPVDPPTVEALPEAGGSHGGDTTGAALGPGTTIQPGASMERAALGTTPVEPAEVAPPARSGDISAGSSNAAA